MLKDEWKLARQKMWKDIQEVEIAVVETKRYIKCIIFKDLLVV